MQPNALAGFEEAFWGVNAPRLRAIKAQYDPLGVFSKPLTVQGVPEADSAAAAAPAAAPAAAHAAAPPAVPVDELSGPTSADRPGASVTMATVAAALLAAASVVGGLL